MSASPYGRFRPVLSAALVAWIERTFVEPAREEDRAAARAEAFDEFGGAEIELIARSPAAEDEIAQDEFVSRANGVEWYRISLPRGTIATGSFEFQKPSGSAVRMERQSSGNWLAMETGKPAIEFEPAE